MDSDPLCAEYWNECKDRKSINCEHKWRLILQIRKEIVEREITKDTDIKFIIKCLSRDFYKLEQTRYISRSNFTFLLRKNGISISPSFSHSLCTSFDQLDKDEIDWRVFIFMLYVVVKPNLEAWDYLRLAFRFFVGSVPEVDSPCRTSVIFLENLNDVLKPLILPKKMSQLLEEFYLVSTDVIVGMHPNDLSEVIGWNRQGGVNISYNAFDIVVAKLKAIYDHDQDEESSFESQYFPVTLYDFRRRANLMKRFLLKLKTRVESATFDFWRRKYQNRRRLKQILTYVSNKMKFDIYTFVLERIRFNAIKCLSAIEIQRMWRGCSARIDTKIRYIFIYSATLIQTLIRKYIAKRTALMLKSKRIFAAIELQRFLRGCRGRDLTKRNWQTLLDMESNRIEKEHEEQCLRIRTSYAIKIQRRYRAEIARRNFIEAVKKAKKELEVRLAIEKRKEECEMEHVIYQKQLFEHYEKIQKEAHEQKNEMERIEKQKAEVQLLHRRLEDRRLREEEEVRSTRNEEYKEFLKNKLEEEWKLKEEERCEDYKQKCLMCLDNPEILDEKRNGKKIRTRIKKR